jgi:hypothetical protein
MPNPIHPWLILRLKRPNIRYFSWKPHEHHKRNPAPNPNLTHRYAYFAGVRRIGGGAAMLADPSGVSMGLLPDLLDSLPLTNFILPGLFLVIVMGILPIGIAWGLWRRQP